LPQKIPPVHAPKVQSAVVLQPCRQMLPMQEYPAAQSLIAEQDPEVTVPARKHVGGLGDVSLQLASHLKPGPQTAAPVLVMSEHSLSQN
jgi:hypothetical protein